MKVKNYELKVLTMLGVISFTLIGILGLQFLDIALNAWYLQGFSIFVFIWSFGLVVGICLAIYKILNESEKKKK